MIVDNEPFYKAGPAYTYDFKAEEKKLYKRLKKKKDKSWKYWDIDKNPITFEINRLGYRSKTVLPPTGDYFVACGCSNTYGHSLHEEDRYSNLIESDTNIPVINLGVPGSGPNFIMMNLFKLLSSGLKTPKAVFIQWPHQMRMTFPTQERVPNSNSYTLRLTAEDRNLENFIRQGDTVETYSMFSFNCTINFLEQYNIKHISFSVHDEKFFPITKIKRTDEDNKARDDLHMGSDHNKRIANYILDQL